MTEPHDEARIGSPAGGDSCAEILFEEYWSDISSDSSIEPDRWLGARRGDPAFSSRLHILSALRNAAPEIGPWLSPAAVNRSTDVRPLSTGSSNLKERHTPCLSPGELVDGRLRILAELGSGGMGEVYVAWHQVLEREVAVKVLPSEQTKDKEAVSRFKKSIALHAKTGAHPNIVGVTDAGQHNGHMYLVMEYVAGTDLARLHHGRHPIPCREVCEWMRQAACGLEHAHRSNLVHRDIKPANLIRAQDGTIKLLDWGLVRGEKTSVPDSGATKQFVGMGTADYISPEQACDAASADAKSDLYSLGCTFYQLLVGKAPFAHHKTNTAKIVAHSTETPPPLRAARPDAPAAVADLVEELLEKEPRRRPESAGGVVKALEAYLDHEPPPRPRAKKRLVAALALCGIATLVYYYRPSGTSASVNPLGLPKWERLELAIAPDIHDSARAYDPTYFVVKDGERQPGKTIRTFTKNSAFRFEGRLSTPVPWVVAWIDSAGKFSYYPDDGGGQGVEVAYPSTGFAIANPKDPRGVQLVVVLVDSSPVNHDPKNGGEWERLIELESQSWTVPPSVSSDVWLNMTGQPNQPGDWRVAIPSSASWDGGSRGQSEVVARDTGRSFLRKVESRLPKGIVPIAAFYFRTE